MLHQLRQIITRVGPVDATELDPEANLYDLGLTSHGTVTLMLELEDAFAVEFPDETLTKDTFSSLSRIANALKIAGVEDGPAS